MNRKMTQMLQPSFQLYFVCLILFAAASAFFSLYLAAAEAVVVVLLGLYYRENSRRRRREIAKYIENVTGNMDVATKDTMVNSPLPMVIFRPESDDIIWTNDRFLHLAGEKEHLFDAKLSAVIPGFDTRWLLEGKNECPGDVAFAGRRFLVYGHLVRASGREGGFLATTYWVDVTEFCQVRDQFRGSRPVMAVLLLDNYEDLMKNQTENQRSTIYAEVNARLDAWVAGTGGMLRRMERDRYLFLFEEQYLSRFVDQKFDILDTIHQVVNSSGLAATLSIGVGRDADSFDALFKNASLALEMALSRGGDQAVVKDRLNFQFYGGRAKSTEKRTKVKSRVMANALGELMDDARQVYVMGHSYADMDSLGAAAGVCCIARKRGKKCQIVIDTENNAAHPILRKLVEQPEYHGAFLTGSEAFLKVQPGTLLVVVDTNRPGSVESEQLLETCNRVAVIDHHRRGSSYIEKMALNYHEPYASSASELVTELLQYLVEPGDILKCEAEALLAGIVLDTKNFTNRTGGRTFEAAAYLRRAGADTSDVQRMFQGDLKSMIARYDIIRQAQLYRGDLAVAALDTTCDRVTAAKAADELLTLKGIRASFVLYPKDQGVYISARSLGEVNVQVIVEALGGGGNSTTAGGQLNVPDIAVARTALLRAIDEYFEK